MTVSPPSSYQFKADIFLFDIDGTLMDSSQAIVAFWKALSVRLQVDGDEVLKNSQGRRTLDVLRERVPDIATEELATSLEAEIPGKWGHLAHEVPGASRLLSSLPQGRWAVVTSGSYPLATGWFKQLNWERPEVFITSECVNQGKPDPACYILGHQKLASKLTSCKVTVVFEDAPAGIRAGKGSGAFVIGLATTYEVEKVKEADPDIIIKDLNSVLVEYNDSRLHVTIRDPLYVKNSVEVEVVA